MLKEKENQYLSVNKNKDKEKKISVEDDFFQDILFNPTIIYTQLYQKFIYQQNY